MTTAFRPVNAEVKADEPMTMAPSTPTPTKASFSQRPLPTSPFPKSVQIPESIDETRSTATKDSPQQSVKSRGDSEDVSMEESDGDGHGDDGGASDDDSANGDGSKLGKKRKSQRFYCTDYPPCTLSFTRSEHLARHIRKHTGERPFQCHCSRRFSRLDNLRQHAQTVHVNEDIPVDSLAATGTRFQRQIRTDRVRQTGRARASTGGGVGPVRGHGKSLSTSSINSISSTFSVQNDVRRRPPPLVMADSRAHLLMDSYHGNFNMGNPAGAEGHFSHRPISPSEYSTPNSATFSTTTQSSPRWGSSASPITTHSRSHSMYSGCQTPSRRLSVPSSGGIPFQSPHGHSGSIAGRPLLGHGNNNNSSASGVGAFSPGPSFPGSPTAANGNGSNVLDEAWRRRTWHPDSSSYSTTTSSRLNQVTTPSQFRSPVMIPLAIHSPLKNPDPRPHARAQEQQQQQQQQPLRLPGIESFGPIPTRTPPPSQQLPSPMAIDSVPSRPPLFSAITSSPKSRHSKSTSTSAWDMGLHRGLTRLDITSGTTPPKDGASTWALEAHKAVEAVDAQPDRPLFHPSLVDSQTNNNAPLPTRLHSSIVQAQEKNGTGSPSVSANRAMHQHTISAPLIGREARRHHWLHQGPSSGANDGMSSHTPPKKMARVERMVHPNMDHFSGFPTRDRGSPHTQQHIQLQHQHQHQHQSPVGAADRPGARENMLRLEALVAVATSENNASTAAY